MSLPAPGSRSIPRGALTHGFLQFSNEFRLRLHLRCEVRVRIRQRGRNVTRSNELDQLLAVKPKEQPRVGGENLPAGGNKAELE
eukprot:scaffold5938_cov122-Isochrysis_galbana.AAC.5